MPNFTRATATQQVHPPPESLPPTNVIRHFQFTAFPDRNTKVLAIRLRSRLIDTSTPRSLLLINVEDALRWAETGASWAFWKNPHNQLSVSYKLRMSETSRTLSVARFVMNCCVGEGVLYKRHPFDIRSSQLTLRQQNTAGNSPVSELAMARERGHLQPRFVDWAADLVEPDRVDLDLMVEKIVR